MTEDIDVRKLNSNYCVVDISRGFSKSERRIEDSKVTTVIRYKLHSRVQVGTPKHESILTSAHIHRTDYYVKAEFM